MAATWRMGDITFHILYDGTFKGDGGVFFGQVPKTAWKRKRAVDEENSFPVPVHPVLAEVDGKRILVETGMGDKHERAGKFARFWGIDQPATIHQELAALGIAPEEIDVVILTHLHFDHAGGSTRLDDAGRPVPSFPRARHLVQRAEYGNARYPSKLDKGTYFNENLIPLEEAGLWELLEGDTVVMPGVETIVTPGHIPWLQIVRFESRGRVAVVASDLIPSSLHLRPAWNTAYDLDPATNAFEKSRHLARAARGGWHLFFYHDPDVLLARVLENGTLETVIERER